MSKRIRQYIGLLAGIIAYYIVHEGAHFLYSLCLGVFKQINFLGLGVQVDVYSERMTQTQLGIFCLLGPVATIIFAYILVAFIDKIGRLSSKIAKACSYYTTMTMLMLDPLYLSLLCRFFGGGDMNGIALLFPEEWFRIVCALLFVINIIVFIKVVVPKYKLVFGD